MHAYSILTSADQNCRIEVCKVLYVDGLELTIDYSFLEKPVIDFVLKPIGFDINMVSFLSILNIQ